MLKKMLIPIFLVVFLFGLFIVQRFYTYGIESQQGAAPGLVGGVLSRCPPTPNCVNSEYSDDLEHYIEPIPMAGPLLEGYAEILPAVIQAMGGEVTIQSGNYLASVFTSSLFGFTDDLELRVDVDNSLLHLRSGSRVGHGDLGVNSSRVLEFRQRLQVSLTEKIW